MAAAYRSREYGFDGGGAVVVNKPSGVVDGDVLIAHWQHATSGSTAVVTSAGWTAVTSAQNSQGSFGVLKKVASSEPSLWDFDADLSNDMAVCVSAYSGASGNIENGTIAVAGGDGVVTATLTTTLSGCLIACAGEESNTSGVTFTHTGGSFTEQLDVEDPVFSNVHIGLFTQDGTAPGSKTITVTSTDTGMDTACVLVLIEDSGGGAPPQVLTQRGVITYVSGASANAQANAQSVGITVNKPAGVSNRDVLYAFIGRNSYAVTTAWTCTGWTQVSTGTMGSTQFNDRHYTALRKVIVNAAGEPGSYTFVSADNNTREMVGTIICLRGVDNTTPEDLAMAVCVFASNDATPAMQDATSVTAGAMAVTYCQLSMTSGTALKTWGAPSTYTTAADLSTGTTVGALELQAGLAYKLLGAAGSTAGTNVWTHTADDSTSENLTSTVLVRPALVSMIPSRALRKSMRRLIKR